MARPTTTRAELRRAIARELKMPFFRRHYTARTGATSSGGVRVIDTALSQANDFWNGAWLYVVDGPLAGQTRLITDFVSTDNALVLEYSLGSDALAASDAYEIHSLYSPLEIHDAINRAINDGFPYFYGSHADETLVLQEDKLTYSLTSLTTKPWIITRIMVETSANRHVGGVTSATSDTILDTDSVYPSDTKAGWLISIYDGTGAGQLRTVGSVDSDLVTITLSTGSGAWTTTPDSTSKYCLWDPNEELSLWQKLASVRWDNAEYPDTLYLNSLYSSVYGMRLRLEYMSVPEELVADSGTTVVPSEFIINRALAVMYAQGQRDNRADLQRYRILADDRMQKSEQYMRTRAFPKPARTRWLPDERGSITSNQDDNPLDW